MKLKIKLLDDTLREFYEDHGHYHEGDSGLDLFVVEDVVVKPGETAKLKCGFKAEAFIGDKNVSYLMLPRSSIYKTPLRQSNSIGLIDAKYRGELMFVVDNIKDYEYEVKRGDRLCQLVGPSLDEIEFELVDKLSDTSRGEGGFGSTGK